MKKGEKVCKFREVKETRKGKSEEKKRKNDKFDEHILKRDFPITRIREISGKRSG